MTENHQSLCNQLINTASLFRVGREIEASVLLQQSIDNMLAIISTHANKEVILALVPQMLKAQENHDWLNLADTLEHELAPLI